MDIRERAYETLLWVVIAIKVTWTIVDLFYLLARAIGRNDTRVTKLQILNEQTLNLAELLMNVILVLIFYPRRKTSDIKITYHEQIIIFLVGALGIVHTNWDDILGLFGISLPKNLQKTEHEIQHA